VKVGVMKFGLNYKNGVSNLSNVVRLYKSIFELIATDNLKRNRVSTKQSVPKIPQNANKTKHCVKSIIIVK